MLLFICLSVCVPVSVCLIFGVFMKLQFILGRFIVILFMHFREFPRGMHISLVKVALEIHGRKGDSPNCVFYLFCWVQTFGLYF